MNLADDIKSHPCLRAGGFETVGEAETALKAAHRFLMSDNGFLLNYLYQRQVEVNRELKKRIEELDHVRTR